MRRRHRDDLVVAARIVLHREHADRPHDHAARHEGARVADEHADLAGIRRERVRNKP